MASSGIRGKNPAAVALGRRAALKRWGPAKTAHLDDFTPEERAFIHSMIEAEREAKRRREGAA